MRVFAPGRRTADARVGRDAAGQSDVGEFHSDIRAKDLRHGIDAIGVDREPRSVDVVQLAGNSRVEVVEVEIALGTGILLTSAVGDRERDTRGQIDFVCRVIVAVGCDDRGPELGLGAHRENGWRDAALELLDSGDAAIRLYRVLCN